MSHFPPLGRSDHEVLFLQPDRDISTETTCNFVYDLRQSHLDKLVSTLNNFDWKVLLNDLDTENACNVFYDIFRSSLSATPRNLVNFSGREKPWITSVIKVLINKRWSAYRKKD